MEENQDTSVEDAESSKMDEAQEVTDTDNSLPQKPQVLVEVDMEVVKGVRNKWMKGIHHGS